MSSADEPGAAPFADPDRTARARIRDAALARFAADGVAATSIKSIAADAGVSGPLVIHHFGSKEGLRVACDEYVVATIRDSKKEAMAAGPSLDVLQAFRDSSAGPPLLSYLARTVVEPSEHLASLVDDMVDAAVDALADGERTGIVKPTEHPRERAVVLTLWQLGALVLHEHARRLLGVDLLGPPGGLMAWGMPAAEILSNGVLEEGFYERMRKAAAAGPEIDRLPTAGPSDKEAS